MKILIDGLACAALILVAIEDARRFRIRNCAVVALLILFVFHALVSGSGQEFLWHAFFGLVVLLLMFGAFSLRLVGAGDAKLLAAGCLWVGPGNAIPFAISLLGLTGLYALGAKLGLLSVRTFKRKTMIPFGPSIAGSWIVVIALTGFQYDF